MGTLTVPKMAVNTRAHCVDPEASAVHTKFTTPKGALLLPHFTKTPKLSHQKYNNLHQVTNQLVVESGPKEFGLKAT